jgi:hypothetical protein
MTSKHKQHNGNGGNRSRSSTHPPKFEANTIVSTVLRFQSSGTSDSLNVSSKELAAACGMMQVSSTTGYSIAQAVKVRRIDVWAQSLVAAGAVVPATVSVFFTSGSSDFVSTREISDTSTSTAVPAHVSVAPPSRSLQADWCATRAANTDQSMFNITAPQGAICDVHVSYILCDGNASSAITISGGVAGILDYQPLDGDGGVWIPIGKSLSG